MFYAWVDRLACLRTKELSRQERSDRFGTEIYRDRQFPGQEYAYVRYLWSPPLKRTSILPWE